MLFPPISESITEKIHHEGLWRMQQEVNALIREELWIKRLCLSAVRPRKTVLLLSGNQPPTAARMAHRHVAPSPPSGLPP